MPWLNHSEPDFVVEEPSQGRSLSTSTEPPTSPLRIVMFSSLCASFLICSAKLSSETRELLASVKLPAPFVHGIPRSHARSVRDQRPQQIDRPLAATLPCREFPPESMAALHPTGCRDRRQHGTGTFPNQCFREHNFRWLLSSCPLSPGASPPDRGRAQVFFPAPLHSPDWSGFAFGSCKSATHTHHFYQQIQVCSSAWRKHRRRRLCRPSLCLSAPCCLTAPSYAISSWHPACQFC